MSALWSRSRSSMWDGLQPALAILKRVPIPFTLDLEGRGKPVLRGLGLAVFGRRLTAEVFLVFLDVLLELNAALLRGGDARANDVLPYDKRPAAQHDGG